MAKTKLQKDFEQILARFQAVSRIAAQKSRESITKAHVFQQKYVGQEQSSSQKEKNEKDAETQPLLGSQKVYLEDLEPEIQFNEALIQEREQDLQSIERSVAQVNEIFRDLGTLVHEQQYMLDNIESNVASVSVNVENATSELRTAHKYQLKSRNKLLCLLSVALIILTILIIALQPWNWSKS